MYRSWESLFIDQQGYQYLRFKALYEARSIVDEGFKVANQ